MIYRFIFYVGFAALLLTACTPQPSQAPSSPAAPIAASPAPNVAPPLPTAAPPGPAAAPNIAAPAIPPGLPHGTVVAVVDGDTLDVDRAGTVERIRLIGIDTPETVKPNMPVECFGREASAYARCSTARRCPSKPIPARTRATDTAACWLESSSSAMPSRELYSDALRCNALARVGLPPCSKHLQARRHISTLLS